MSHGRLKLKCQGDIENVRGTLRMSGGRWGQWWAWRAQTLVRGRLKSNVPLGEGHWEFSTSRGTLRILNVPWDVENSQAFRRDAGKRLFLSQSLSRTEAKTELTVIMAMPWPYLRPQLLETRWSLGDRQWYCNKFEGLGTDWPGSEWSNSKL